MSGTSDNSNLITISADPPTFPITIAKLDETRTRCLAMRVAGVADTEGFKIANRARMDIKADRCAVQNRAKELKQQVKKWQDENVEAPAKSLIDELAKIETYLESQTEPVKQEKERLAKESKEKAEKEATEKLASRIAAFVACRAVKNSLEVAKWSDEQYAKELAESQQENETRKTQEAAALKKQQYDAAELEELRKLRAASPPANSPAGAAFAPQVQPRSVVASVADLSPLADPQIFDQSPPVAAFTPVAATANHDRERRRLFDFADFVETLKTPVVERLSVEAINKINRALRLAADAIREVSSEEFPEQVATTAAPATDDLTIDDV